MRPLMRAVPERIVRIAAAATAVAVLAAGCSLSVEQIPLPGGADLGDHPYSIKVEFPDAVNLVPQASVRVNDVPVGRVKKISLPKNKWAAEVTLLVNGKVRLPKNAYANLEQSSLLGEKYIRLAPPPSGAAPQPLADGDTIPLSRTSRNADTEEVFGALSMLLSGGGLPQIRAITRELNNALGGREFKIRSTLERLNGLTTQLNISRQSITGVIDGLSRLSSTVAARRQLINTTLDDLPPGLAVLEDQREELVGMLLQLDKLGEVTTRLIRKSKDNTVRDLQNLAVIARKLADAGRDLPKALEVLITYPFTDEALKGVKGDYMNVYLSVTAAPGNDCVIPKIPEVESEEQQQQQLRALAAEPSGPQPPPCPEQSAPPAGAPQIGGAPQGQQGQQGTTEGGQEQPALPLPSIGD